MNNTAHRLREVCKEIRRKSYPIADLIPLLQQAADELDDMESIIGNQYELIKTLRQDKDYDDIGT